MMIMDLMTPKALCQAAVDELIIMSAIVRVWSLLYDWIAQEHYHWQSRVKQEGVKYPLFCLQAHRFNIEALKNSALECYRTCVKTGLFTHTIVEDHHVFLGMMWRRKGACVL